MSGIEGVESGFWAGIRGGQKAGWISLHVLYGVSSALSRRYWVSVEIWASMPSTGPLQHGWSYCLAARPK
jgi:hypothetical protein